MPFPNEGPTADRTGQAGIVPRCVCVSGEGRGIPGHDQGAQFPGELGKRSKSAMIQKGNTQEPGLGSWQGRSLHKPFCGHASPDTTGAARAGGGKTGVSLGTWVRRIRPEAPRGRTRATWETKLRVSRWAICTAGRQEGRGGKMWGEG